MTQMDIEQGVFTLNGHTVSGWSDSEDCLSFPQDIEMAAVKTGADGKVIATRTADKGGEVTIKVLANSPTVVFLSKLIKQMDNGVPVVFEGSWNNPVVGEQVNCFNGTLITAPKGTTYGKGAVGEKVYVIHFERIDETPESMLLEDATGPTIVS